MTIWLESPRRGTGSEMGGEKLPEINSVFLYELGGNPRHLTVKPLSEDLHNVGLKVAEVQLPLFFLHFQGASL
jgi:hypothetical protein